MMRPELAERLIDEAKALGFDSVRIAGGEPFLYPDILFGLLEYAKKAGFEYRIVKTNGFWGEWTEEELNGTAERLKECATHVSISFDSFHAAFVSPDSVWRAAGILQQHRIDSSLHIADVFGRQGAGEFLASLGEKAVNQNYTIRPLEPIGNMEKLPPELFIRLYTPDEVFCETDGFIAVDPDGTVFPCASPAARETGLCPGNVMNASLSEILSEKGGAKMMEELEDPKLFREFIRFAKEQGVDLPEKAVGGCELCSLVFRNPETAGKAGKYLEKGST